MVTGHSKEFNNLELGQKCSITHKLNFIYINNIGGK